MRRWEREEIEEVEYVPTSVRDVLREMRDTAELMLDLSWSAVVLQDPDIAEEVRYLEARVETLNFHLRMNCMLAARDREEAEQLTSVLQVAEAAHDIAQAMGDVAGLVNVEALSPGGTLGQLQKLLDEVVVQVPVKGGGALEGELLDQGLVESRTGMRVVAIRRGRGFLFDPDEDVTVREGDVLIARGVRDGAPALREMAGVT